MDKEPFVRGKTTTVPVSIELKNKLDKFREQRPWDLFLRKMIDAYEKQYHFNRDVATGIYRELELVKEEVRELRVFTYRLEGLIEAVKVTKTVIVPEKKNEGLS